MLHPSNWRRLPNHATLTNRVAPRCSLLKRSVPLPPNCHQSTPHLQKSLTSHRFGQTPPCLELEGPSPYEAAFLLFPPRLGALAADPVCSPASCSNQHRPQTAHTNRSATLMQSVKPSTALLAKPLCSVHSNLGHTYNTMCPPNRPTACSLTPCRSCWCTKLTSGVLPHARPPARSLLFTKARGRDCRRSCPPARPGLTAGRAHV